MPSTISDYFWAGLLNLGVLLLAMIGASLLLRQMYRDGEAIIDAKLVEDSENMGCQKEGECG